ncbi:MAG: hypothetical protein ACRER2_13255 [Methylococcales bacterium]
MNEGLNLALSVAPNVISQVEAYGLEFEKYNKGSIAYDLVLGLIGGRVANAVTGAFPLEVTKPLQFFRKENLAQFTTQQTLFYLYNLLTGYGKLLIANTKKSAQEAAVTYETVFSAAKSVAGQLTFPTALGKRLFPDRFQSFLWRLFDKPLSLIFKTVQNRLLDLTPRASPEP